MGARSYFELSLRVYGFALVMALCAIVPGVNLLYSGHGGPAWLALPFVFPVALVQLVRHYRAAPIELRPAVLRFALISAFAYLPLSFVAAVGGASSIQHTLGLTMEPRFFWGFFIFPFGLLFCGGFFGL